MKILAINKFFYPRGGAETVFLGELELLRSRGHEVIPFSMDHPQNLPTAYARYFVSNVELGETSGGLRSTIGAAGRILYSREAERKLDALLTDERPDVAHLHNIYHQLSPAILRALVRHNVPAVMTLHDYKLICPSYTLYANEAICERCRGGRFYNAVLQGCVKGSRLRSTLCATEAYLHEALGSYRKGVKLFIAPSRFLASKVVEFGIEPRRIVYLPNFVKPLAHPSSGPVGSYVLFAGRLERVKGVRTLIEAWSYIDTGGAELWIAGDGEDRLMLEALTRAYEAKNVRFLGYMAPDALMPVIEGASFTVAPSEWYENAPLSVLEAAARGKAVITTKLGGLPELVDDGVTGVLVPPSDPQALGAAIAALLRDPARTARMGMAAQALVASSFGPDQHYSRLMDVYGGVIGETPGAAEPIEAGAMA